MMRFRGTRRGPARRRTETYGNLAKAARLFAAAFLVWFVPAAALAAIPAGTRAYEGLWSFVEPDATPGVRVVLRIDQPVGHDETRAGIELAPDPDYCRSEPTEGAIVFQDCAGTPLGRALRRAATSADAARHPFQTLSFERSRLSGTVDLAGTLLFLEVAEPDRGEAQVRLTILDSADAGTRYEGLMRRRSSASANRPTIPLGPQMADGGGGDMPGEMPGPQADPAVSALGGRWIYRDGDEGTAVLEVGEGDVRLRIGYDAQGRLCDERLSLVWRRLCIVSYKDELVWRGIGQAVPDPAGGMLRATLEAGGAQSFGADRLEVALVPQTGALLLRIPVDGQSLPRNLADSTGVRFRPLDGPDPLAQRPLMDESAYRREDLAGRWEHRSGPLIARLRVGADGAARLEVEHDGAGGCAGVPPAWSQICTLAAKDGGYRADGMVPQRREYGLFLTPMVPAASDGKLFDLSLRGEGNRLMAGLPRTPDSRIDRADGRTELAFERTGSFGEVLLEEAGKVANPPKVDFGLRFQLGSMDGGTGGNDGFRPDAIDETVRLSGDPAALTIMPPAPFTVRIEGGRLFVSFTDTAVSPANSHETGFDLPASIAALSSRDGGAPIPLGMVGIPKPVGSTGPSSRSVRAEIVFEEAMEPLRDPVSPVQPGGDAPLALTVTLVVGDQTAGAAAPTWQPPTAIGRITGTAQAPVVERVWGQEEAELEAVGDAIQATWADVSDSATPRPSVTFGLPAPWAELPAIASQITVIGPVKWGDRTDPSGQAVDRYAKLVLSVGAGVSPTEGGGAATNATGAGTDDGQGTMPSSSANAGAASQTAGAGNRPGGGFAGFGSNAPDQSSSSGSGGTGVPQATSLPSVAFALDQTDYDLIDFPDGARIDLAASRLSLPALGDRRACGEALRGALCDMAARQPAGAAALALDIEGPAEGAGGLPRYGFVQADGNRLTLSLYRSGDGLVLDVFGADGVASSSRLGDRGADTAEAVEDAPLDGRIVVRRTDDDRVLGVLQLSGTDAMLRLEEGVCPPGEACPATGEERALHDRAAAADRIEAVFLADGFPSLLFVDFDLTARTGRFIPRRTGPVTALTLAGEG